LEGEDSGQFEEKDEKGSGAYIYWNRLWRSSTLEGL
jgi:hypothetical protein